MTKFIINGLGWVYLVVVLDWYTKKIVGYSISLTSKPDDWLDALNKEEVIWINEFTSLT
ncbi:hypothetical protein [Desulfothermus sp.]